MSKQIPTTVFSGFLGSGKTTVISHIIDILQKKGVQIAYIKNEIGETDIDAQLMKGKDIETKELLNGCICCTLVGPFENAVTELIEKFSPERIFIEASGAADPAAIALMIGSHPSLSRDGIISVIDVVNFKGYEDLSTTAQRQTQFTDLIIFNKVEEVDVDRKRAVVGYVRALNTHSPIIEAPGGKVNPNLIFGLDPANLEHFLKEHAGDHSSHNHIDDDEFSAFTIRDQKKYSEAKMREFLETLPKSLFRTKGVFQNQDGVWFSYNGVGKKIDIVPIETEHSFSENILVFIGVRADGFQNQIKEKLQQIL